MSKHTPGPWDYGWRIQPNGCPTVGARGLMVCMLAHSAKNPTQMETALANANLIAAAPDLLEALESCVDQGCMTGDAWVMNKALAAIARAKGEKP